jgi:hypothetical protein
MVDQHVLRWVNYKSIDMQQEAPECAESAEEGAHLSTEEMTLSMVPEGIPGRSRETIWKGIAACFIVVLLVLLVVMSSPGIPLSERRRQKGGTTEAFKGTVSQIDLLKLDSEGRG